jgi:hypothetical protein
MNLPRFFLIGAAKCGTTAAADTLAAGGLFLPENKEPNFFSNESSFARGLEHYATYYRGLAPGQPALDASPQYLLNARAPERLLAYDRNGAPPCRFVVLLRNPVDRAHSSYWQARSRGDETRPFEAAVRAELEGGLLAHQRADGRTLGAFIEGGRYAEQLERWFRAFPRERFLIRLTEELRRDPARVYADIFRFFGLDRPPALAARESNRAVEPRLRWLNRLIRGQHPLKRAFRRLGLHGITRHRLKSWVDRFNLREVRYEPLPPATRAWLRELFAEDTARLRALLDRDLAEWEER